MPGDNVQITQEFESRLVRAISSDSLYLVEKVLSSRDSDITQLNVVIIYYALNHNPINEAIIMALLNARNNQHQPLFAINDLQNLRDQLPKIGEIDSALKTRLVTAIDYAVHLAQIKMDAAIEPFTLEEIVKSVTEVIKNNYVAETTQRKRDIQSLRQIIKWSSTKIKIEPTTEGLIANLQTKRDEIESNHRYYGFLWLGFKQPPSRLVQTLDCALKQARAAAGPPLPPNNSVEKVLATAQSIDSNENAQAGCFASLKKLFLGCFTCS